MDIIEFKEQVYKRILSQYLSDVRKTRLTLKDRLFFPVIFSFLIPIIYYMLSEYSVKNDRSLADFFPFLGVFLTYFFGLFITFKFIKDFIILINFKKQSDKFFGTNINFLPILTDQQLREYLTEKSGWYLKKIYTTDEKNELVSFTPEELKEMKNIVFNKDQKELIINRIKKGFSISFYTLDELVAISDETSKNEMKLKQDREEEELMNSHQFILDAINYKPELEMEMNSPSFIKQKIKQLL